jgi:methionyl-tRNA synthetase
MIVYPVLLKMMTKYKMIQSFYTNQFLTLNGKNLSTSRNHAIWARDLVDQACVDSARLYLASVAPEASEGDFDVQKFTKWRAEVFDEIEAKLIPVAESERRNGGVIDIYSADASKVNAFATRWR